MYLYTYYSINIHKLPYYCFQKYGTDNYFFIYVHCTRSSCQSMFVQVKAMVRVFTLALYKLRNPHKHIQYTYMHIWYYEKGFIALLCKNIYVSAIILLNTQSTYSISRQHIFRFYLKINFLIAVIFVLLTFHLKNKTIINTNTVRLT